MWCRTSDAGAHSGPATVAEVKCVVPGVWLRARYQARGRVWTGARACLRVVCAHAPQLWLFAPSCRACSLRLRRTLELRQRLAGWGGGAWALAIAGHEHARGCSLAHRPRSHGGWHVGALAAARPPALHEDREAVEHLRRAELAERILPVRSDGGAHLEGWARRGRAGCRVPSAACRI